MMEVNSNKINNCTTQCNNRNKCKVHATVTTANNCAPIVSSDCLTNGLAKAKLRGFALSALKDDTIEEEAEEDADERDDDNKHQPIGTYHNKETYTNYKRAIIANSDSGVSINSTEQHHGRKHDDDYDPDDPFKPDQTFVGLDSASTSSGQSSVRTTHNGEVGHTQLAHASTAPTSFQGQEFGFMKRVPSHEYTYRVNRDLQNLMSTPGSSVGMSGGIEFVARGSPPRKNDRHNRSIRSIRSEIIGEDTLNPQSKSLAIQRTPSFVFSDCGSVQSSSSRFGPARFCDSTSVKSLASIGLGSTDGKRLTIRKVPTSPTELLNMMSPPTPPLAEDARSFDDSDFEAGCGTDEGDSIFLKPHRRMQWASKLQFVLACVGYTFGLGNIWRFPYLCYKSGGGVFLIPYFIILVVCGIPMLYMELAVGQFTGRGPIGALGHLCPIFKGAGLASVVISFIMSTYHCVLIAYAIYYLFSAFRPVAPWSHCGNSWNSNQCWTPPQFHDAVHHAARPNSSKTPAEEFFNRKVLYITSGIEEPGGLRWDIVAYLICAWMIVYFAIWKSIKSSAKARYFTATFPFLVIVMFLTVSLSLDGAYYGLRYFFHPRWELLLDVKVWVNAIAQNFNSMGITYGSMICFASYNKYNNNIFYDTIAISLVNVITSLIVGIFTFATIGNIAFEQNKSIEDVIDDGPGLVFVVYPEAIAKMPASQFWGVLFFFMMLCLGLNSQFAIVEVVVTSIQDGFPKWIRRNLLYHEILVFIICSISFICGLPNVTEGGIYFFQLVDHYVASISIMYVAFFEVIAIAWFYGAWRLSKNVEDMNGKPPSLYFRFCWLIFAPLLLLFLWVFVYIDYTPPTYDNGKYHYPRWAIILGWCISFLSILCIPVYAIIVFIKSPGANWKQKLRNAVIPDIYDCKICGQNKCEHLDKEFDEIVAEGSPMLNLFSKQPTIVATSNGTPKT